MEQQFNEVSGEEYSKEHINFWVYTDSFLDKYEDEVSYQLEIQFYIIYNNKNYCIAFQGDRECDMELSAGLGNEADESNELYKDNEGDSEIDVLIESLSRFAQKIFVEKKNNYYYESIEAEADDDFFEKASKLSKIIKNTNRECYGLAKLDSINSHNDFSIWLQITYNLNQIDSLNIIRIIEG